MISLTSHNGEPLYIRPAAILAIRWLADCDCSELETSGGTKRLVRETPREIIAKIGQLNEGVLT